MSTLNLGWVKAVYDGTTPPTNTKMLWFDTNTGVNRMKRYDYDSTSWIILGAKNVTELEDVQVSGVANLDILQYDSTLTKWKNVTFTSAFTTELTAVKGVANGVASLDVSGKVPISQLPSSILNSLEYKGVWDASTNTPAIPAASPTNKGNYYIVDTPGTTTINGINDWGVNDWIISNGVAWNKIDNSEVVYTTANVAEVGNLYFTNARARQAISATGIISYDNSTGVISMSTGTDGYILKMVSGTPTWSAFSALVTAGDSTSGFGANRVPYLNASSQWASYNKFLFDGTNLVVGHTSASAHFHVRGDSASTGSAVLIENLTPSEIFRVYNSRNVIIGGDTVSTGVDYKIKAFGTGTADTHSLLLLNGYNDDNVFDFKNTNGFTRGGLEIRRGGASNRQALAIRAGTSMSSTRYLLVGSNGASYWENGVSLSNLAQLSSVSSMYLGFSNDSTYPGLYFGMGNDGNLGFHYSQTQSSGRSYRYKSFVNYYGIWGENLDTAAVNRTISMVKYNFTYNWTGTSYGATIVGIDYDPTETAFGNVTGHTAMLIRAGRVGIGLGAGANYPTSQLQVKSANGYNQFRLETQYTPSATGDTNGAVGDICFDNSYIYYKTGSGWKRAALSTF